MSETSLFLGGIIFRDFEVPEQLVFGGAQRVVAHELIGGGRAVDILGEQPTQISFSGVMSGINAIDRAQELDAARIAGNTINLGWQSFVYNVVITELRLNYEKSWWIPFEVRCIVVSEPTVLGYNTVTPLLNLIGGDLNSASAYASQAGLSGVTLTATLVRSARVVITTRLSSLNLQFASKSAAVVTAVDGFSGIDAVTELAGASGSIAAVAAMNGYVNRAAMNIALGNL
ncbi:MAG: hypothetical protein POG74_05565 [Acidocella sp.]|nr:hypothetical protein [Acidocella sp.]